MGYAPWTFRDNTGVTWALGVDPDGQATLTEIVPAAPQAVSLVPLTDTLNGLVYGLTVVSTPSGPMLEAVGPLSIPAIGNHIPLSAAGISQPFWLQTEDGNLVGEFQGPPDPPLGPTSGGCFAPWIFVDDQGDAWAMGVSVSGQLTLASVSPVPTTAMRQVPLRDTVDGHVYGISVTSTPSGPLVTTTGPLSIHAIGRFIPLSAAKRPFWLQTANGLLIGSWQGAAGPADPMVGELFNYDVVNPPIGPPNLPNAGLPTGFPGGYLPNYTQSVIGGQSLPAQANGAPFSKQPTNIGLSSDETGIPFEIGMGMNTAGCGHWFNNYEQVFTSVGCQPYSLVVCPLCRFVQEMFPISVCYDEYHEHISS